MVMSTRPLNNRVVAIVSGQVKGTDKWLDIIATNYRALMILVDEMRKMGIPWMIKW